MSRHGPHGGAGEPFAGRTDVAGATLVRKWGTGLDPEGTEHEKFIGCIWGALRFVGAVGLVVFVIVVIVVFVWRGLQG
jgi:hypothetical protein